MSAGDRFGTHRVREPAGGLPQAAWRLDNDASRVFDDEIAIDVETLNVDSASFRQMEESAGAAGEELAVGVARRILETVATRGKLHNPVTGSGGMLVGRVARIGARAECGHGLAVGDRIATLVSLSLTPLRIDRVRQVRLATHQVDVEGQAILFSSGALARMPADLDERVALAALDVAGAAPQVARLCDRMAHALGRAPSVLVLGCGGKSGLLVSAAARRAGAAPVVGIERSEESATGARRLGACHAVGIADAGDALAVASAALTAAAALDPAAGAGFDLTVSCVNVDCAEMGAILATRDGGTVYFFSMATSFTRAALGAEGVSRDVAMLIGNGYCPGHAEATLGLLDEDRTLRAIFIERFGGPA